MEYVLDRETVIQQYIASGRKERDDLFRRSLALGPTERRWLGWSGTRVLVLRAYLGSEAPLCPTPWKYEFTSLGKDRVKLDSSEINFCDDDNILDLLQPWNRSESIIRRVQDEIEHPALMYYI
jgi:hypothetical protein